MFVSNTFAADNTLIKYSEICNEKWTIRHIKNGKLELTATAEKLPSVKSVCTNIFKGTVDTLEIEKLTALVNSGNITAWFLMGYYIFEHDQTPTKETEMALNLIKRSAFWANPYAHAYLYELYSTKKHGIHNEIEAALSLAHFQSFTDVHNLTISSTPTENP